MNECLRCHGDGEIEINRSPINDPQCAEPVRCHVCGGSGVVPVDGSPASEAAVDECLGCHGWGVLTPAPGQDRR